MEELNGLETEEKLTRYHSEILKCRLLIAFLVCHFLFRLRIAVARWDANTSVACLPDAGICQLEAPLLMINAHVQFAINIRLQSTVNYFSIIYVQNCCAVNFFLFQLPSYGTPSGGKGVTTHKEM
jgi:hypothetical protein